MNQNDPTTVSTSAELKFGGGAIFVDDVPSVLDFYRRAFGFETRFFDPEYGYGALDTGPAHLGIASHKLGAFMMPGRYEAAEAGQQSFTFEIGFVTEDVPAAFARAVAAGARVVAEPRTMPWGATVAYVRSIEGTLVVLSTPTG
jgi:lactoylglutathione lyase